jgi:ribosomal protein L17
MRIRLSELKRIIRSEVRRSLYENLSADMVGRPQMPTDADRARAMKDVEQLINSATAEQLLGVLKAAADSNQEIPSVVKNGIAALENEVIQVSHRHRRGIRLYEGGGDAITALLASRLGNDDDDEYLPDAEDAQAEKKEVAAILAGLGLTGTAATVVLGFFAAPIIVTLGVAGVSAALVLAAQRALQKAEQ